MQYIMSSSHPISKQMKDKAVETLPLLSTGASRIYKKYDSVL